MKKRMLRLLSGFIVCFICASCVFVYAAENKSVRQINSSIVRFHIKANSDDKKDQKTKMLVRDYFFETVELEENMDKEETLSYFRENEECLEKKIDMFLKENGANYKCDIIVNTQFFPVKKYNGFTLPSGVYDAVVVKLGKAEGENFFCVVYPSLCILDGISQKTDENMKLFLKVLDENEAKLISSDRQETLVKFKIVEIIDKIFEKTY